MNSQIEQREMFAAIVGTTVEADMNMEPPEADPIERIRKCMKLASEHPLVNDPEAQFRGALVAALQLAEASDEGEHKHLVESIKALGQAANVMNAMQAGVAVDMEAEVRKMEERKAEGFVPIRLMELWTSVTGQPRFQ